MITPLGQRQIFQTANVEAVRVAHEVSEQMQREQARRIAAEERVAEEKAAVQVIGKSDQIRTEERQSRRGGERGEAHEKEDEQEASQEVKEGQAPDSESHLDFLA